MATYTSRKKIQSPKMLIVIGLIFAAVGVGVLIWGVMTVGNAYASESWPTTTGEIVESRVDRRRSSGGSNRSSSTTYHAEIGYTYTVDGTTYDGDRVNFGEYGSSNSSHARSVVRRYPVGQSVEVRYDPADPATSCLEAGMSLSTWFVPGFGALFAVVGGGILLGGLKKRASQNAASQASELDEVNPSADATSTGPATDASPPVEDQNPYRQQ